MILIVEDDQGHIDLIKRAFERSDSELQVEFATSLRSAREHIEGHKPDLVIVDRLLPDGKGTDLLGEAVVERTFPLIVMTSHGDERIAVEAMKAGALDYVVKSPSIFTEMPRIAQRALREWGHIMARQAAERAVRKSEADLHAYFDAAAQGIVVLNAAHQVVMVNRQFQVDFGYNADEIQDQPMKLLIAEPFQDNFQTTVERFLGSADNTLSPGLELDGQRKDGTTFPMEISLSRTLVDGEVRLIALGNNITERRILESQAAEARRIQLELEQEKRLRQDKDRFLSMVSHEFRTPLSIIRTSNNILKKHYARLTEEQRIQNFFKIDSEVEALDQMISDILLLTKSGMNLVEYRPVEIDLVQFCAQVVEYVCKGERTARIHLRTDLPRSMYAVDPYLLEHILVNILSNGLKYSPEHSTVTFEVRAGDGSLQMVITDQGVGIPEHEISTIFDPFKRAENVQGIEGTGIGLAIVKEFVRLHGGTVSCHSQLNKGTSFRIEIPTHENPDH
ncbi:two-component system, OmpR family, sensor histidine kinase VicK [Anaerolineae bacterium]|nr:two-component system, OmpR family, sensor histidine kinase VicK [Anaerolineae bacterium]